MKVPWSVSLVAAVCLLAASAVRPDDVRPREGESRQLLSAACAVPACLTLRHSGPRLPWRSWPYDVSGVPMLEAPAHTAARLVPRVASDIAEPVPPVPLSRGPPRG